MKYSIKTISGRTLKKKTELKKRLRKLCFTFDSSLAWRLLYLNNRDKIYMATGPKGGILSWGLCRQRGERKDFMVYTRRDCRRQGIAKNLRGAAEKDFPNSDIAGWGRDSYLPYFAKFQAI